MTTFVYIYWHKAAQGDELRWSIRSVEKHFRGQAEIVIAGDRPPWFSGKCLDIQRKPPRLFDVHWKLLAAVDSPLVSDQFVWMMDDIYFVRDTTIKELAIPKAAGRITEEQIQTRRWKGGWQKQRRRSFAQVLSEGLPAADYATHLPHVFEKEKARQVYDRWDMLHGGFLHEIMYGALHWRNPASSKVLAYRNSPFSSWEAIDAATRRDKLCLCNGNGGWNQTLRSWLMNRFPDRSPFEIDQVDLIEAPKPLTLAGRSLKDAMMRGEPLFRFVEGGRPTSTAVRRVVTTETRTKTPRKLVIQLPKDFECPHRGEVTRTVKGRACPVRDKDLEVFACSLHGEVTASYPPAGEGIKTSCNQCSVYHDFLNGRPR